MIDELVERLKAAGFDDVPASQHPVFENLDPGGTRLTTLSTRAGMTHQSMGELVSILEGNGYVERRPDPTDRRARLVCLTDKGRALVRQAIREIADIEAVWLDRLSRGGVGRRPAHGAAGCAEPGRGLASMIRGIADAGIAAGSRLQLYISPIIEH